MTNGTEGPWTYDEPRGEVRSPTGRTLAKLFLPVIDTGGPGAEEAMDANGRRMAAAPELLTACTMALGFALVNGGGREVIEWLEAAIRKAEGTEEELHSPPENATIATTKQTL